MKKIFSANQFVATKWEPAEAKAKFCNQFVKFVEGGFKWEHFPKWFYTRLSLTFGHIAHYNQLGFYETFFTNTNDQADFIQQTLNYPAYGDPTFTYSDAEKAIKQWLQNKLGE